VSTRTAIVVGATGLIGGECLTRLLDDAQYGAVVALTRRPLARTHPKLRAHVVDFGVPEQWQSLVAGDDVFCCLGTTIKKAGSQDAFRSVDYGYAMAVARAARGNGVPQFLLVSALGAHPRAMAFYSRVKGELEEGIAGLGFPGVHIFRPSLLVGEREESRLAEHVGLMVGRVLGLALIGPLRRFRPIAGATVAACMIATAKRQQRGTHIHESDQIADC
jgi:uncharacterized protein YbjT (DUF2867 family)